MLADPVAPTRVMLSDDHPFVRRGLRTILESTSQYEVCGEAGDGNQTLELAKRLRPDIGGNATSGGGGGRLRLSPEVGRRGAVNDCLAMFRSRSPLREPGFQPGIY